MKTIFKSLFFILFFTCACSRMDSIVPLDQNQLSVDITKSLTRGEDDTFNVTLDAIAAYTHYKELLAKSEETDFEIRDITPLGLEEGETLCYVINYGDGWEVVSADKRTPVVLAHCDTGYLNKDDLRKQSSLKGVDIWLNGLERDVRHVRESTDFMPEDEAGRQRMEESLVFWQALLNPSQFILENTLQTKAFDDPFPDNGHWELIDVTTTSVSSTVCLTTTQWGQGYPFNNYCPPPELGSTLNSVAGCVAVAGAQQLYFLHNRLGVPSQGPTSVFFSGYGSNYTMTVGGYSSSVWANMGSGYSSETGILIAYVGGSVSMQYGLEGSGAYMDDLVQDVFEPNGIQCTYSPDLNINTVYNNLKAGFPVVTSAAYVEYELGIPQYRGHTFLIDKSYRTDYTTIYTYEWVEDEIIEGWTQPRSMQRQVVSHSTTIHEIGMNWGWNGSNNDSLFVISGSWGVNNHDFDYIRRTISNFAVL